MIKRERGIIFVVSAPSGTGKTTLCKMLLSDLEGIVFSVSYTTRPPRKGEVNGRDYFFVSEEEFRELIKKGELVEYALVYGNFYGTSKSFIEEKISNGLDVLLDIDVQGAKRILEYYTDAVGIFIFPPSFDELRRRLEKRGTDSPEAVETRLMIAKKEMKMADMYHYWIVNDHLERAYVNFKSIFIAERSRSGRLTVEGL